MVDFILESRMLQIVCTNMSYFVSFFKTEMIQESNLSKFKSEVQSSQVLINYDLWGNVCYVWILCFMILVHKDVELLLQ